MLMPRIGSEVPNTCKKVGNVDHMWTTNHKSKNVDGMWAPAPPNVATYVNVVWHSKCCINMFHIYVLA
jgi:hypothetical protein